MASNLDISSLPAPDEVLSVDVSSLPPPPPELTGETEVKKPETFNESIKRMEAEYGPNYERGQELISRAGDIPSGLTRVGFAALSDLATMGNTKFYQSGDFSKALAGEAPRDIIKRGGGSEYTDILYNLLLDTLGPSMVGKTLSSAKNLVLGGPKKITPSELAELHKQEIKHPEVEAPKEKPIEDISDYYIKAAEQRKLLQKAREDIRKSGSVSKEKELQALLEGSGGVVVPVEKLKSLEIPRVNEILSETKTSRGLSPEKYYARSGQQMPAPIYEQTKINTTVPEKTTFVPDDTQMYLDLSVKGKSPSSSWELMQEPAKIEMVKTPPNKEFSSVSPQTQTSVPLENTIRKQIQTEPMYTPVELREWPSLNIGTKMPEGYAEIPAKTALQLNRVVRNAGVRYEKNLPFGQPGKALNQSDLSDLSSMLTKAVRSKDPKIAKLLDEQGYGKDIQRAIRAGEKNPEAFLNPKTAKGKEALSAAQKLIGGDELLSMREKIIKEARASKEEGELAKAVRDQNKLMERQMLKQATEEEAKKQELKNAVKTIGRHIPILNKAIYTEEAASAAKKLMKSKQSNPYLVEPERQQVPFWMNAYKIVNDVEKENKK